MTEKRRDGEHNPLERPKASKDENKVVADGTSHVDEGVDFVFQTEVGMNLEASQVAARHFELAMFRQQGTTAKSTDRGGDYTIQADFALGGRFRFSNRGWDEPRSITSRHSPFRIGNVSATTRDNSEEHR